MYITQELPLLVMSTRHRLSGNEREVMKLEKLQKFVSDTVEKYEAFDHFTSNTWTFEISLSQQAWNMMSQEERALYNCDVTSIDHDRAVADFIFGIRRFYLKEDILSPESQFKQLLAKQSSEYLHDVRTAYRSAQKVNRMSVAETFPSILSHDRFNAYVAKRSHMNMQSPQSNRQAKTRNRLTKATNFGKSASALTFNVIDAKK